MRSLSFQVGTDYASQMGQMLSLKRTLPADRSAFDRIKAQFAGAQRPAFGRRPSPQPIGPCNYFARAAL